MGVGKSTVCQKLMQLLTPSVYLDGDWCWNMNPFVVSEENKQMVLRNIGYLLRSFLHNAGYEYIIFCWVIHQQKILDDILAELEGENFQLCPISLVCTEDALRQRLRQDIDAGLRTPDILERSVARLPLYQSLTTQKLDVSTLSADAVAAQICAMIAEG